ncbi:MAG: hypothetical protein Kow0092_38870 [Deferrisomatales bacterium]
MLRLIFAVLGTIVAVAFFMANTHPVAVSFVFGPPVPVRLIFLLLTAYGAGLLTAFFYLMVRSFGAMKRRRELTRGSRGKDLVDLHR